MGLDVRKTSGKRDQWIRRITMIRNWHLVQQSVLESTGIEFFLSRCKLRDYEIYWLSKRWHSPKQDFPQKVENFEVSRVALKNA
ncbi:hypothetical protein Tcan_06514 [Toxocara canis]|uniref:Uncharacterized protein n=1 Tax=Toxocara canis TaxID=6265 RepID=A0A0B2VFK0_TOXCA|nr:hypothetical protein Tcan_06514 [Toxocara canis]